MQKLEYAPLGAVKKMKWRLYPTALTFFVAANCSQSATADPAPSARPEIISAKTASSILKEWETLKPGISSRADLLKIFSRSGGGVADATRRTYGYKNCANILVDVTFSLSKPKEAYKDIRTSYEGLPSDIISTISKPYIGFLSWD